MLKRRTRLSILVAQRTVQRRGYAFRDASRRPYVLFIRTSFTIRVRAVRRLTSLDDSVARLTFLSYVSARTLRDDRFSRFKRFGYSYTPTRVIRRRCFQRPLIFITAVPSPPTAPLEVRNLSANTVIVEWGVPETDGGAPLQGYNIAIRDEKKTMWMEVGRVDADVQKFNIKDLQVCIVCDNVHVRARCRIFTRKEIGEKKFKQMK